MNTSPFNCLRMGPFSEKEENWKILYPALTDNRPAFDEFWFSTGCSYPVIGWHEESARRCAICAEDLRKAGIQPSIEFQTILGHADAIAAQNGDNSGAVWGKRVEWDGTTALYTPCPRDPEMQAYFRKVAALHAAWHPYSMWVDDDFCVKPRSPTKEDPFFNGTRGYGCFCRRCLEEFSAFEGKGNRWTRESLTEAMREAGKDEDRSGHSWRDPDYGEKGINRKWLDFQIAGLESFANDLASTIHAISPETTMGYEFGRGHIEIARGLAEGSGHQIRIRPGGGAYYDTDARSQIEKAYVVTGSAYYYKGSELVSAKCPEIESCPRTVFCRTPQGIILEAFEDLAFGMDFLSMFVANWRARESMEFYHRRLFPRIAAAIPYLKAFRDANRGASPCGFTVPGDVPAYLVAERCVPVIVKGMGVELGALPSLSEVDINVSGSGWDGSRESRVAQIMCSSDWRNWVKRADEVSGCRLPVIFTEPAFAFTAVNVDDDFTLRTVAVINASIDRQEAQRIILRGIPEAVKTVSWHMPEAEPVVLTVARNADGDAEVVLPVIGAWQGGYLYCR